MLATATLVAFAPTADLDRARDFFAEVLGLRLVEATPIALVFDAGGSAGRNAP
jgi:catechol 2,3-dioxygenase-like lactoylglutathione lyase family enzyme